MYFEAIMANQSECEEHIYEHMKITDVRSIDELLERVVEVMKRHSTQADPVVRGMITWIDKKRHAKVLRADVKNKEIAKVFLSGSKFVLEICDPPPMPEDVGFEITDEEIDYMLCLSDDELVQTITPLLM